MAKMNLTEFAEWQGISRKTAGRWYEAGTLPYPAERVGRLIMVDVPDNPTPGAALPQRTAVYLNEPRSVGEIKQWTLAHGMRIDETHREQSTSPDSSAVLKQLLANPAITRIITDFHPNADIISAALAAHGREFITTAPHRTFKPRIASSAGA